MPATRRNEGEFDHFRSIKKYQVRVAEEALDEAKKVTQAYPHAEEILARLCKELETFPPNAMHFSEPEISFNGVQVSHAVVASENLVIRMIAHYRLNAICMLVHVEAEKSR
jgi:hypothetical protein